MAFQTGTKVDPRLMQADYSGFANAASIRANAMDKLGSKIGSIIEDYAEKKQEKIEKDNFEAALLPYATKMAGGDAAEAKKLTKVFSGNPKNRDTILGLMQLEQDQEKANVTLEALNAVATGTMKPEEALAMGIPASEIKGAMDLTKTKSVTYSQVKGFTQLMEEQFSDVKVDESTGETYMEVPKTGDYIPFNTERVPANIPESLKTMPGYDEWKKSKMSPSSSRDYSSMGMSVVK